MREQGRGIRPDWQNDVHPESDSKLRNDSSSLGFEGGGQGEGAGTVHLLQLLGTAWLLEPDETMLAKLALLPGLEEVAARISPDDAALEYSRVVLQLVPPYASLFLDDDAMLNSHQAEQVELEYRRAGFVIRPEWRAGPADHLGLELHFLAHLISAGSERAGVLLDEHLLAWAPVCLLAIQRVENAELYPPLATLTLDALRRLHQP